MNNLDKFKSALESGTKYHMLNIENFVKSRYPDSFYNDWESIYHKLHPMDLKDGVWLAGGAVRDLLLNNKNVKDWDFFYNSEDYLKQHLEFLMSPPNQIVLNTKTETPNCITLNRSDGLKVQLIKIAFYPSIFELLDSFDYTICQFAMERGSGNMIHRPESLWDLARKRLVINKITYPIASVRRLVKYGNRGFTFCDGTIRSILGQTIDLHLNNNNTLQTDTGYMD